MSVGFESVHELPGTAATIMRTRYNQVCDLRPPDEVWIANDLPEHLRDMTRKLLVEGIIHHVDRELGRPSPQRYRTDRRFWEALQAYQPSDVMPCGHRGFSNLGDGQFECVADHCSETFCREEVERCLGR